jgi:guanylate kinase
LEERLIKRGTDDIKVIKDRMKITADEIVTINKCEFIKDIFINDDLDKTYKAFREKMIELYPQISSL